MVDITIIPNVLDRMWGGVGAHAVIYDMLNNVNKIHTFLCTVLILLLCNYI